MSLFGIHFFICNLIIALSVLALAGLKRLLKGKITECAQYRLWFFFFALLLFPFLPLRISGLLSGLSHLFSFFAKKSASGAFPSEAVSAPAQDTGYFNPGLINDFTESVNRVLPAGLGTAFCIIWLCGIFAASFLCLRSAYLLYRLEKSALPLENVQALEIFRQCRDGIKLTRNLPVYTTAYLKSPVITGIFKPRILLPLHLLSDCDAPELKYILLHELQHYRHRDILISMFMNLTGILYWFNPFIWYALSRIRNDREIACDAAVLRILDRAEHTAYGHTLLNFAEKLSSPFSFSAGIGGERSQLRSRILAIVSYRPVTAKARLCGAGAYLLALLLLFAAAPSLTADAVARDYYYFGGEEKNISSIDLSAAFGTYDGSFVLYDMKADHWKIYNDDLASLRVSPDSTYKIYAALLALESGVITPEASLLTWNGTVYEIDAWNMDHDLSSAMKNSVNWYFQSMDRALGAGAVRDYYQKLHYGNEDTSGGINSYWLESTLKISPVEQVELLKKLYTNEFHFQPENIEAVKTALCINSNAASSDAVIYGKTGTGRINGKDQNGWFIGFVESRDNVYFFALNIQGKDNASGSAASALALETLQDLDILY